MANGLLYEPRSFWSIQRTTANAPTTDLALGQPTVIQFNRDHFTNGSPYPITLTRMALAAPNYTFRQFGDGLGTGLTPDTAINFYNSSDILNACKILISAPQRQHYSRHRVPLFSFTARPNAEPGMDFSPDAGATYSSGLFGINRLAFDRPLIMPRLGSIEFDLGGFQRPGVTVVDTDGIANVRYSILYEQEGGLFSGMARTRSNQQLITANYNTAGTSDGETMVNPDAIGEGGFYYSDGFNPQGILGTNNAGFPPANRMSARLFDQQESSRSGDNKFLGMSVALDQIGYDEALQTSVTPGVVGAPINPLSMRIASRIRTINGGSGYYWWRPGAPLALVLDTITPALVFDLLEPITLGPGDTLDVELEVPPGISVDLEGTVQVTPHPQVGISFNGFAAIEG